MRSVRCGSGVGHRGLTLIEVLVTVVVLGIAGALVIPSMTQTGDLRVQAAVRTVVADIAFVQSDAVAYQGRRVIWFNRVPTSFDAGAGAWTFGAGNGYTVAEVNGPSLDLSSDALFHPDRPSEPYTRDFDQGDYGGATLDGVDIAGDELLIFDELGGPVADLTGETVGIGGTIELIGDVSRYTVTVAPVTGRVTVEREDVDGGGG